MTGRQINCCNHEIKYNIYNLQTIVLRWTKLQKLKKKKKLNELDRHCRWNIITLRKTFCEVMILECTDIFSGALTRNRKLMNIHVCSAQRPRKSQTPNISEHRTAHFQRRITDCSIVFQINKYVNLACS